MKLEITSSENLARLLLKRGFAPDMRCNGNGRCGGCRVKIGDTTRFVCVDGPEFDGRLVDWDSMLKRLQAYRPIERRKMEDHICRMEAAAKALEQQR